jgi:hypothetical protein
MYSLLAICIMYVTYILMYRIFPKNRPPTLERASKKTAHILKTAHVLSPNPPILRK